MPPRRKPRPRIDFEEIRPWQFVIHNDSLRPVLRGDGVVEGNRFTLTDWRRDGLVARLRARTFVVQTLDDLVAKLPALPSAPPLGPHLPYTIGRNYRYSYFDPNTQAWAALEAAGDPMQVLLCPGWSVRRRRGRGQVEFYQAVAESSDTTGLQPLSEDAALLAGYAQVAQIAPLTFAVQRRDGGYMLPDLLLPPAYRELLRRLGEQTADGWQVMEHGWPMAQQLYARLGITLHAAPST